MAKSYLAKHGYIILAANFFTRKGEIDLITYDVNARQIVFVEVKSLGPSAQIDIHETVRKTKKRRIIMTCLYWLQKNGKINNDWRIDFVGIVLDNEGSLSRLVHLKAAIY
jgi:putative endonuclease